MDKVILHCKDLKAFQKIAEMGIHCFFHNKDLATITSRGWAWFYPSKSRFYGGVNVLPELHHAHKTMNGVFGVCTDFPTKYRIGDLE
ncbi:MAG: hypothetical protein WC433_01700 [Candidatus Omnitrophota bacterium]